MDDDCKMYIGWASSPVHRAPVGEASWRIP